MATTLREDLETDDVSRQAMALLQVLNAIASGNEVGGLTSIVCRSVVRGVAAPQCKRLAYDVVRAGGLADSDWDDVCEGIKTDVGSGINPEVQSAALEVLPLIPPFKLAALLAQGSLHPKLTPALRSPLREVRAAALKALGSLAGRPGALHALGASKAYADSVAEWISSLGDALLDTSHAVVSAAHACARRWLEASSSLTEEPERTLKLQSAKGLASHALAAFPAVLARAQLLPTAEQANSAAMLVELVQFAHAHHIEAVKPPKSASGGTLPDSLLGADVAPSAAGEAASFDALLFIGQVGSFLQPLLASLDPVTVFEAAKGLLLLGSLRSRESPSAVPPTWAPLAIAALVELRDAPQNAPASSQLLDIITSHIQQLQPLAQVQLTRQLMPTVAAVASADARAHALARLWLAIVALELRARRAHRSGDRTVSSAELKNVLSDPVVFELVSGNPIGPRENAPASAKYPAFREELVGTLLSALLAHHAGRLNALQGPGSKAQNGSAGPPDVADVLITAADMHARASLCDWTSAAKIALQGTKACLGWDRGDASGGMHASTAIVDIWLGLLQHALHAVHLLVQEPDTTPLGREIANNRNALLELLNQLIVHWKVLSPAVQPRALWLAAHHASLGAALDGAWAGLLKALADALSGNEDATWARRHKAGRAAAAEGILAAADSTTLSRGAADPFGAPSLDEGAVNAEAAEIGLLSAERLAALVVHNAGEAVTPAMKDLAASLAAVVQPQTQHGRGGPDTRERCARLLTQLSRLVTAPSAPVPEDPAQQGQVPLLVPDPDWAAQEGYPLAAPSGPTLQSTKRVMRYWALHDQLAAATADAAAAADPPAPPTDRADAAQLPSLLQVVSLVSESDAQGLAQELSGPADPLKVAIAHVLDLQEGTVALRLSVGNRLSAEIRNIIVRVAVSGPIAPDFRQPPLYKMAALPAGETIEWRLRFRLSGFGTLSVQPLLTLPAKSLVLPGDDPSVRTLPLTISSLELLTRPPLAPPAPAFFLRWASLPAGVTHTGVAARPGAAGGVAVLAALEAGPWRLVSLQPLPAQGGFHAAFSGQAWDRTLLALVVLGHLAPGPQGGHVLCRVALRSPVREAAETLARHPTGFLPALTNGTLLNVWDIEGLQSSAAGARGDEARNADGLGGNALIAGVGRLYRVAGRNGDVRGQADQGELQDVVSQEWLRARNGAAGVTA